MYRSVLLFSAVILGACALPSGAPDAEKNLTGQVQAFAPAAMSRQSVTQAAEMSFGLGRFRDDVSLSAAGREVTLRLVSSQGLKFAVMVENGFAEGPEHYQDLSTAMASAAQSHTGCIAGAVWRRTYTTGAMPKYAVHVIC